MKKLLILSGKGGTGKTTTAAAFIAFENARAFADCDVDAPNLHLVMQFDNAPISESFYGLSKSNIDCIKCIKCSKCFDACRFGAIRHNSGFYVDEYACEGCGVCQLVCPTNAIQNVPDIAGKTDVYIDDVKRVFSTAKLKMGRGNSGKLVSRVKANLYDNAPLAHLSIIDGSPGIGCPVIASLSGVDMVLIVTEPSLSGLSDLKRIIQTAQSFEIKIVVCINKYDLNLDNTKKIEHYCRHHNIKVAGVIPFDTHVSKAINESVSIAHIDCPARNALKVVYENIMKEF